MTTRRPTLMFAFALVLLAGACSDFPELKAASRSATGPAPHLVPIDGILAQADALSDGTAEIGTLQARAAALRARAARLRRM